MLRIARTASRCTCGSLSSSSSVRSGSASLPPNSRSSRWRSGARRVRRVLQAFDLPRPADPNRCQIAVSRSRGRGALLDRQRFGERPDQHLAERHAHRLDPLELGLVDCRRCGRRCAASSSRPTSRSMAFVACWRRSFDTVLAAPARTSTVNSSFAGSKSPTSSKILDAASTTGLIKVGPAVVGFCLDAQQVEDQVRSSGAARSSNRPQPCRRRSGGSS